jgi:hypothetical protein
MSAILVHAPAKTSNPNDSKPPSERQARATIYFLRPLPPLDLFDISPSAISIRLLAQQALQP